MILSFYRSKSHSISKPEKKRGKILPRIGNTTIVNPALDTAVHVCDCIYSGDQVSPSE